MDGLENRVVINQASLMLIKPNVIEELHEQDKNGLLSICSVQGVSQDD